MARRSLAASSQWIRVFICVCQIADKTVQNLAETWQICRLQLDIDSGEIYLIDGSPVDKGIIAFVAGNCTQGLDSTGGITKSKSWSTVLSVITLIMSLIEFVQYPDILSIATARPSCVNLCMIPSPRPAPVLCCLNENNGRQFRILERCLAWDDRGGRWRRDA